MFILYYSLEAAPLNSPLDHSVPRAPPCVYSRAVTAYQGALDRWRSRLKLYTETLARNWGADLLTGKRQESFPLGFMRVIIRGMQFS
jgi:hypothetical protein